MCAFVWLSIAGTDAATTAKKTSGKNSTAATGKKRTATKGKKSAPRQAVRQASPTPERYREIQQALAAKGYLPTEQATGQWNDSSTDALKRFQSAQNLDATGKINSLSLIALGLGPKRDTGAPATQ